MIKSFVLILSLIVLYVITTTQTVFAEPTITVSIDKSSSILCGSPIKMVLNSEGKVDEAAKGIVSARGTTMEPSLIFEFLNSILLQIPGISQGPLGSTDPIIKGMIPSAIGIVGIAIALNLFNSAIRKKMVDQDKLRRLMKDTRAWQKERMTAFRAKDQEKINELNKKSAYMSKMNMELMQMNMRPMMITFIPMILIFYFVLPPLFAYTVAVSPISLNFIPGDFFQLTCTAAKVAEVTATGQPHPCQNVNEIYFWAWYFLSSIAFSGIIMRLTKTTMDLN